MKTLRSVDELAEEISDILLLGSDKLIIEIYNKLVPSNPARYCGNGVAEVDYPDVYNTEKE